MGVDMELSYRIAKVNDLDSIFDLVQNTIKQMKLDNIHQWDNIYPTKADFNNDILRNELYVGIINEKIVVVYALNKECDEQYKNGKWQYIGNNFIVIHRLCVAPDFQKKGIANITLLHIENELRYAGVNAVKLDVFCENPYALKLYSNNGYDKVGIAHWRKGKFLLMEKLL